MISSLIQPAEIHGLGERPGFDSFQHRLNAGQSLTYWESFEHMSAVLAITDPCRRSAQLGVLLNGLMSRRPTVDQAVGVIDAALALDHLCPRDRPRHPFAGERVIGLAGSGKKGLKTANISTPAAIVAATAGVRVAKTASRATSSVAGSADTLVNVGVRLLAEHEATLAVMGECGLGVFEIEQVVPRFDAIYGGLFFAPHVLSLAFPALLLPIQTDTLMYGIAHPDVGLSLEVLRRFHTGDLLVVSSTPDNLHWIDEANVVGETSVVGVHAGERGHTLRVRMAEVLGVGPHNLRDLLPSPTALGQAETMLSVLSGRGPTALVDAIAVNAATLIHLARPDTTIQRAFQLACDILAAGAAMDTLARLVRASGGDPRRLGVRV